MVVDRKIETQHRETLQPRKNISIKQPRIALRVVFETKYHLLFLDIQIRVDYTRDQLPVNLLSRRVHRSRHPLIPTEEKVFHRRVSIESFGHGIGGHGGCSFPFNVLGIILGLRGERYTLVVERDIQSRSVVSCFS